MSLPLLLVPQDGLPGTRCSGPGGPSPLLPSRHLPYPHCHLERAPGILGLVLALCRLGPALRAARPRIAGSPEGRLWAGGCWCRMQSLVPEWCGWRALEAAARCLPGSPPAPMGGVGRCPLDEDPEPRAQGPGMPPRPQCGPAEGPAAWSLQGQGQHLNQMCRSALASGLSSWASGGDSVGQCDVQAGCWEPV